MTKTHKNKKLRILDKTAVQKRWGESEGGGGSTGIETSISDPDNGTSPVSGSVEVTKSRENPVPEVKTELKPQN